MAAKQERVPDLVKEQREPSGDRRQPRRGRWWERRVDSWPGVHTEWAGGS